MEVVKELEKLGTKSGKPKKLAIVADCGQLKE